MPLVDDPRVLVDAATRDDAAVYQISDDRAVVASVDFFAPIVDDPQAFGVIAATNAFSDLYAMGATPLFALNLVAWPRAPDMLEILGQVLKGGSDVARDSGAFVLGGHSIDDPEPKYGMVTIGEVHPDRLVDNTGARPGDVLVLSKPLGTGVMSTALKRNIITEAEMVQAVEVMSTLNAGASRAMAEMGGDLHAATDVTGFGLLGHLHNLLEASGVAGKITASAAPLLDGARKLTEEGHFPGGTERNLTAIDEFTRWADGVEKVDRLLLSDAQTSGGLLIAVASSRADDLIAALQKENTPVAAVVGEVVDGTPGGIEVI